MSNFRNPPRLSPNLAIGAYFATARRLGLARRALVLLFKRGLSAERRARGFAGYEPTEHDVFVATFSKSGTNLAMQIALQTAWLGEAEFDHIHDIVAWPEVPFGGVVPLAATWPYERAPTGLRLIKTALAARYVPYREQARYITVVRDPKELCVSGYHFFLGQFGLKDHISAAEWYQLFVDGMAIGWAEHTASFWAWRDRSNVLLLSFREVQGDLDAAVRRIAEFIGVTLSESQRARVQERSSFAYMKKHGEKFNPPRFPFTGAGAEMMRSGKSGASDELLDRGQQSAIDRRCRAELVRLGSDFPYAEFFDVVE